MTRVNCPYCGVWLSYEGLKPSNDWSFLRCAECESLCVVKSEQKKKILLPKKIFSSRAANQTNSAQSSQDESIPVRARSKKPLLLGIFGITIFAFSIWIDPKRSSDGIISQQDRSIVTHQSAPTQIIEYQKVEVTAPHATLRSGPGLKFKKMGTANPGTQFAVIEQEQLWIKIEISSLSRDSKHPEKINFAWIHKDLVKAVSLVNLIEVAP